MPETENPPPDLGRGPEHGPAQGHGSGITVLLVADPGLLTRRAGALQDALQARLDAAYGAPVHLEVHTAMLRLRPDGTLDFAQALELAESVGQPDAMLLLTEIPRLQDARPLIAEIFPGQNVAVISGPTLGAIALRRRVLDALVSCAVRMIPPREPRDSTRKGRHWERWQDPVGSEGHQMILGSRVIGGARTVVGMVAGNEPLRTAPRLSSAMAAAAATGAFGIFYSSIWSMSMYLTTQRLVNIGLLAMLTMTLWLILGNRLWDTPKHRSLSRVVLLYNLSTVLTLLMIVALLYAGLVVLIFTSALIVIDPDYLAVTIENEVSWKRYLDIAWLSAAMGVVAGALGSSFDKDTDLRSLTHGQRERQRRYAEEE